MMTMPDSIYEAALEDLDAAALPELWDLLRYCLDRAQAKLDKILSGDVPLGMSDFHDYEWWMEKASHCLARLPKGA